MITDRGRQRWIGLIGCWVLTMGLVGCDYWPPALQAEIEQLRVQIDTLTKEKSELQSQVDELIKAKHELLAQVNDLTRLNQEKSSLIAGLQRQVAALQAKSHPVAKTSSTPRKRTSPPAHKPNRSSQMKRSAPPR